MRGATLYRLLLLALAMLCVVQRTLAQDQEADPTPTPTNGPDEEVDQETGTNREDSGPGSDVATATEEDGNNEEDKDNNEEDKDNNEEDKDNNEEDKDNNEEDTRTNDEDEEQGSLDDEDESFDESFDETGLAGSLELTTPDYMTVPTPMFEIGEKVTLGWKYSNDTKRPPTKLTICGKFPRGKGPDPNSRSYCDWDIAVNISGSLKKYVWDTKTTGAPGIAFSVSTGYLMYFYDAEYGVENPVPGAGRMTPFLFRFNMYNSRYDLTNQGIPSGYDPAAAAPSLRCALHWITVLVALATAAVLV
ncbi:hypothetical protein GGF46_004895 [Coemansia sp. RSA 552]|nr:hypothetical protein GGF46_004895 [Coemansia sp. RSA 552]